MDDDDEAAAMRAHFPFSFGKQSNPQALPSSVHSATRRTVGPSPQNPDPNPSSLAANDDDRPMIGPPPPPPSAQADDDDDDDGEVIGPPKPPPPSRTVGSDEDGSDDELDDEPEDFNRIPLSNEIVLMGHSKVTPFALNLYFNY